MDIGIDLGTTFSVLAVNGRVELAQGYPPGIYMEDCDVTVIPTPYAEPTFPSVLMQDPENPGAYLLGTDALQKADEGYAPVMFSKRKIGVNEPIPMQTQTLVARQVAAEFLRYMKTCAEQALGRLVVRAVVTHPAYFDRGAVEETRQAAREAGFDMSLPEQMLMEPVAAALTYTRTDRRDPLRILTYDLGGGTFDVTYLERRSSVIDMKAFHGDHLLGGYNFDRELLHWVRQRLAEKGRKIVLDEDDPQDRGRLARLLRLAEQAKIALAQAGNDTTPVSFRSRDILVDVTGRPVAIDERITRREFVELIRPYLKRALDCCRGALAKAKVSAKDVDEVLLVGGSTYGPWIGDSLRELFQHVQPKLFHPDLCVGAGAAIHAKMVLPPRVEGMEYQLTLQVPDSTALETIDVAGQVTTKDGQAVPPGLTARLQLSVGNPPEPLPLDAEGWFLFPDVELDEDAPTEFALAVADADNAPVVEHAFTVTYAPDTTETSAVTTVAPKPLYIVTVDGPVALTEEGVPLPAKATKTFRRVNDNPSIALQLLQEREPIGEVRIEEIPPEGGRGSFVDLEVVVTAENVIHGSATVRTQDNRVVAQSAVSVHFDVPEVAPVDHLRTEYFELQCRFAELLDDEDEPDAETRIAQAADVSGQVELLLEQQPLERQEVQVQLRRLRELLQPPEDEMKPSRKELGRVVKRCWQRVTEMAEKARALVEDPRGEGSPSRSLLATAEKAIRRARQYETLIDKWEGRAMAAYGKRDVKLWARAHDAITDIEVQVRERPKMEAPPVFLGKLLAAMEIKRHMDRLAEQAVAIRRRGQLRDWEEEIARIRRGLQTVLEEIGDLDNTLPDEQGRAQIQRIFSRKIDPLRRAIERLGVDVSKVDT